MALSVILLGIGSLVEVLDLSMAVIASLAVVFAAIELRGKYPYLVYAATALLSLLLLPLKTPGLCYALFAGYYPLLKRAFEKHFSRPVAWVFKGFSFFLAMAAILFAFIKLFTAAALPQTSNPALYVVAGAVLVAAFVVYDIALTRLITFYLWRLQRHFRFLHKD